MVIDKQKGKKMKASDVLDLKEKINIKAEQINTLALIALAGNIEELSTEKAETLFSLLIQLSNEIMQVINTDLVVE